MADFPAMNVDLQTENVAKLIQLALGPVFLISGVGITLSMLTQRLARIVDRARTLETERERPPRRKSSRPSTGNSRSFSGARATSIAPSRSAPPPHFLTALVVTLLFASEFTPLGVGGIIAVMFVASMGCLSIAFLMFLLEVRIATNALRIGAHRND